MFNQPERCFFGMNISRHFSGFDVQCVFWPSIEIICAFEGELCPNYPAIFCLFPRKIGLVMLPFEKRS
jgi:hypothetical protein